MSVSLTLRQLFSVLGSSFHSIDIRCAVKKYQPGWLSLLTSIRISARPLDAIQARFQELESEGQKRNAEPFRILWHVYPFGQMEEILTGLATAQLSIEGELVRFPEQVRADELRGQLEYAPNLVTPWDRARWPASFYYSSGARTLHFSDPEIYAEVKRSGWGSAEEMVAHFLGLNHQQLYSTSIPLFFYVEMPAKIEVRAGKNDMPDILVRTEPTLGDFTLYLRTDRHKGKPFTMPLENCGHEGIWTLHRSELGLANLEPDDLFSCTLSHRVVPVLDEVSGCLRNFMSIAYLNPLLLCLQQFWDMQGFSDRLERPYDKPSNKRDYNAQHVFQESVAQVLTLAGFQTIDLGKEEFILGKGSGVRRATLDILAYHAR